MKLPEKLSTGSAEICTVIVDLVQSAGKFMRTAQLDSNNVAVLEGLATRLERAGSMMFAMANDVRQCVAEYRQKAKGFPS